MATTLYIAEYQDWPSTGTATGNFQVVRDPPIAEQTITIGASSAKSNAFNPQTRIVRLHSDSVCSIAIGPQATITAAATNQRMAANQTEYKLVVNNAGHGVAVITNT